MKRRIPLCTVAGAPHWIVARRASQQRRPSSSASGGRACRAAAAPAPTPRRRRRCAGRHAAAGGTSKIGFITKFPVDFYDTMVDARQGLEQGSPRCRADLRPGTSGTDDEGEIAAIESMVTQGVKAIVITPTSPNVQDALQKAVDGGIKVILVDNDIPGWAGKTSLVATDNLAGGVLAGQFIAKAAEGGRHGRRPRRASPVRRRCSSASTASRGPRRRLQDRRLAADRLRPDQGSQRRAGHPHRQPRRHSDLRRLRPADPRRHRVDHERRQDGSSLVGFDAGPGRGQGDRRRRPSWRRSPSSRRRWARSAPRRRSTRSAARPSQANIDTGTEMVTKDNAADFGG